MKLQHKKSLFRRLRGQGMSEYLVIVGMIAVAGIVVSGLLGDVLKGGFGNMAVALTGNEASTAAITAAQTAGTDADTKAAANAASLSNSLSSYNQ